MHPRSAVFSFSVVSVVWSQEMDAPSSNLIAFVGQECPHCVRMTPVVESIERKIGRDIEVVEVWHNADNAKRMERCGDAIRAACGGVLGVPAFYNAETGDALCGEQGEDALLAWAQGETCPS